MRWTFVCVALACCGPSDIAISSTPRDVSPTLSDSSVAVSQGIDAFAVAALRDLVARTPNDNIVFSPYSIEAALSMVFAGARGATASEMQTALSFPSTYPTLGLAFDAIDLSLAGHPNPRPGFVARSSNGLWGQRDFVFEQPFLDALATDFGSGVHLADFETQPDDARQTINAWVSQNTDALVVQLLPPGSITTATRVVLVNALVVHAQWAFQFADAGSKAFTLADGTTTSMPTMHQISGGSYTDAATYDAVTLPFADQNANTYVFRSSMTIIVPKPGAWEGFESTLDFRTMRGGGDVDLDLTMPKFAIDGASFSLKNTLVALGMQTAFTPDADFSGITTAPLALEDVIHQARIDVDEQGIVAVASTAAIGGATSLPPPATFVIDRPFYFAVIDDESGTVLFAGRFVHP